MEQDTPLSKGDVVQLHPETTKNRMFAGCFMVITERKSFGAVGYVQALGENGQPGGQAYYRASWEEMEWTGAIAPWIVS